MIKLLAFVALSLLSGYLSRSSLFPPGARFRSPRAFFRLPRTHGFWRFFAWEFIAALFVLDVDLWFASPFSWYQLLSWLLLGASLAPLVAGVRALRAGGRPGARAASEPSLFAFERTATLVTTGIYGWIRHPLYASLLLLDWGVFWKAPSLPCAGLAIGATLALYATARADETECIRFFGPAYLVYMGKTKMFIPRIF